MKGNNNSLNVACAILEVLNEEETIYAIAKKGWRATGLNAPQEFIVKPTLSMDFV